MLRSIPELPLGQEYGSCLNKQSDINLITIITSIKVMSINTITIYIKHKLNKKYIIILLLFIKEIKYRAFIVKI